MRSLVNWKDMVCEFPNRFAQTVEGDKVTLQRSPGTVRTQGTPQNATNFNIMDLAALEAMLMSSEAMRMLLRQNEELKGITGEVIEATLTNSQVCVSVYRKTSKMRLQKILSMNMVRRQHRLQIRKIWKP